MDRGRQRRLQTRKHILDAVDNADDVRSRLPLDVENDGGRRVHPGGQLVVFRSVDHLSYVGKTNGPAIAVGNDERTIGISGQELIVIADRERLARAIQGSLRLIDVRLREGRAEILETQTIGSECRGVHANPYRGLLLRR